MSKNPIRVEELTPAQLLTIASKFTQLATEAKETERRIVRPARMGGPKDPAVRRLAAMMIHRLKEIDELSYEHIANLLGISRERAFQLHHDLVAKHEDTLARAS